jgi:group II intron reverse transcriptase/maturase
MLNHHELNSAADNGASIGECPTMEGLQRIRELAKKDKDIKFTLLRHHITISLLAKSFLAINRKSAPGIDEVCWREYKNGLLGKLGRLHEKIQNGLYKPAPAKRAYIPKSDGTQRELGILNIEDKIVQRAVTTILNAIYEEDFKDFSCGFRPGKNPHHALDALAVAIDRKKVNWILDADIKGYFNSIDHDILMKLLERRIGDKRILGMISNWLKAGVLEEEAGLVSTEEGVQQGGVISPLLSNIYLHYVLDEWACRWRDRLKNAGDMCIIRYADDFVLGFQSKRVANSFLAEMRLRMKQHGLTLHPGKTRLIEFGRHAAEFRKKDGRPRPETFNFLGFTHICSTTKTGNFKLLRLTIADRIRSKLKSLKGELRRRINWDLKDVAKWLKSVVRGYYNYHAIHDNLGPLTKFRYWLGTIWFKTIRRRGQKRKMTWKEFIDKWWAEIPAPKVVHPYPSERVTVII